MLITYYSYLVKLRRKKACLGAYASKHAFFRHLPHNIG